MTNYRMETVTEFDGNEIKISVRVKAKDIADAIKNGVEIIIIELKRITGTKNVFVKDLGSFVIYEDETNKKWRLFYE